MCSQTGPNIKEPPATHTKTGEHTPTCLFAGEKVFSTSQVSVPVCGYTQATGEKQGNNLQHPGLLRMTDRGIKGGGMGRGSSTASTAPHETRREVVIVLP